MNVNGQVTNLFSIIARAAENDIKTGTKVPIVCVVVEGGAGTIKTVWNALKNNTPCVVINGTGRAADLLAFAVKMKEKYPNDDKKVEKKVQKRAKEELNLKKAELEYTVKHLIECVKDDARDKIRVFDFEIDNSAGNFFQFFFSFRLLKKVTEGLYSFLCFFYR